MPGHTPFLKAKYKLEFIWFEKTKHQQNIFVHIELNNISTNCGQKYNILCIFPTHTVFVLKLPLVYFDFTDDPLN